MTGTVLNSGHLVTATRPASAAVLVDAPFAATIVELGHEHPEIVVVSADLSKYTDVAPFVAAFPDRFFQVGMAEQNLMGVAGVWPKPGSYRWPPPIASSPPGAPATRCRWPCRRGTARRSSPPSSPA